MTERTLIALMLLCGVTAVGQVQAAKDHIFLTVVNESGLPVSDAQVTLFEPGRAPVVLWTDYSGRCQYSLHQSASYRLSISKPDYYAAQVRDQDPHILSLQVALTREHLLQQQIQVAATVPGIDTQEPSDVIAMDTQEIVNIPYPTSRDIRNLLPFIPGVVADNSGQVHVIGSETWQTLDTLDGFDIRSPASGQLAMRVSTDAVQSMDTETTRYPVHFGRSTGGVIAFYTGTGDNKFRFNATDFTPSFRQQNGLRFDKFAPRVTFSGPIVRNKAWFFDGVEGEYDNIYIPELPSNEDTDRLIRGSNLLKLQSNLTNANSLTGALLFNDYHSPYDGISALVPQASTVKRDTIAWLPYIRDRQRLSNGATLDTGIDFVQFHDGYEPHGDIPYELTPETAKGSYFENLTGTSQRQEGTATLYLPQKEWEGSHDLRMGIDLDHINFSETVARDPVNYLREDGTLLRQSVFSAAPPFTRHNSEVAAYLEDRWTTNNVRGLLIEPGLRFDWDDIIRRQLFSPRLAMVYAPGTAPKTKVSAGIGIYYEHTQLEYLEEALAGTRVDTYYAADGVAQSGPSQTTTFTYDQSNLSEAHALNWSLGIEQKLPGSIYLAANFIDKRVSNLFTYVNQNGPDALSGDYALSNARQDHDYAAEVDARRTFGQGYTLFASYMWSSARSNAALNYLPTVSPLGRQQSGPLAWNTPNRIISWGWLPLELPWFRKNWDVVYDVIWNNGFPITSVNDNEQVVGAVGSHSFPNYLSVSPGLEWRFHLRGYYFGLRGVIDNATNSANPAIVNSNVDSPDYLVFAEPLGRSFTTRIRLIQSKK